MRNVALLPLRRAELSVCSNLPRAIARPQVNLYKLCSLPTLLAVRPIQARRTTIELPWSPIQRVRQARFFSDHESRFRAATSLKLLDILSPTRPSHASKPLHPKTPTSKSYTSSTKPLTASPIGNQEKPTPSPGNTPGSTQRPEDEALPSKHVRSRSNLSSRFNSEMERLLNALARLSQRVNNYTGTDYSGISSLRSAITEQEQNVASLLDAVAAAKETHATAVASQAASNKEVVRLLERKHSWSDADLERYMGLIRSEHENEQAVQTANDAITQAERDLEEARAELERTERKQYHEEQIWSDTIRRNSTWVTFGLMGFNIILLLASLVIIEPWRRRRLVKEIRSTLAGQSRASAEAADTQTSLVSLGTATESHTAQIVEEQQSAAELAITPPSTTALPPAGPDKLSAPRAFTLFADTWTGTFALWKMHWADLFSERMVALRRVDLTIAAVEGAAAGAAFMGFLFVFLRPR